MPRNQRKRRLSGAFEPERNRRDSGGVGNVQLEGKHMNMRTWFNCVSPFVGGSVAPLTVPEFKVLNDADDNLTRINENIRHNRQILRSIRRHLVATRQRGGGPAVVVDCKPHMRELIQQWVRDNLQTVRGVDNVLHCVKKDERNGLWDNKLDAKYKATGEAQTRLNRKYMLDRLHNKIARIQPDMMVFFKNAGGMNLIVYMCGFIVCDIWNT